jgi:hypothetical protein
MEVTELPMVSEVKPLQPEKALYPMEVTELGIVNVVKPVQTLKAEFPIDVTPLPITSAVICERYEYHGVFTPAPLSV